MCNMPYFPLLIAHLMIYSLLNPANLSWATDLPFWNITPSCSMTATHGLATLTYLAFAMAPRIPQCPFHGWLWVNKGL